MTDHVSLANSLFDAAQAGDATKFLSLCTSDATVSDMTRKTTKSVQEEAKFVASLPGMFKTVKYDKRHYTETADGAVLQHTLAGQTPQGQPVALPVIIRMHVSNGKVAHLEEYYDSKKEPFAPDTPLTRFMKDMKKAGHDPAALNELLAADLKNGNLTPMYTSREGFWKLIQILGKSFTGFRQTETHYIEQGNLVVRRIVCSATHSGQFLGIPATGKKVTYEGFEMAKIVDGKIVEDWIVVDSLSLLQQIGATPETMKLGPKFGVI
jgi:predicted ester cyclase/ketosteroid isomerase-like protein